MRKASSFYYGMQFIRMAVMCVTSLLTACRPTGLSKNVNTVTMCYDVTELSTKSRRHVGGIVNVNKEFKRQVGMRKSENVYMFDQEFQRV